MRARGDLSLRQRKRKSSLCVTSREIDITTSSWVRVISVVCGSHIFYVITASVCVGARAAVSTTVRMSARLFVVLVLVGAERAVLYTSTDGSSDRSVTLNFLPIRQRSRQSSSRSSASQHRDSADADSAADETPTRDAAGEAGEADEAEEGADEAPGDAAGAVVRGR